MNDSIIEYSKIKYVNKLNDLDSIKHGKKIIYVTFIKSPEENSDKNKKKNIWDKYLHGLTICRVINTGQIIYEDKNINGCFSINIDYKICTNGRFSKRINANTFISGRIKDKKIYKNQWFSNTILEDTKSEVGRIIVDGDLYRDPLILKKIIMKNYTSITHNNLNKHIRPISSNNLVSYTVHGVDDNLLNEIENYNKCLSLFQLCVCVLPSKDLEKYNQLYQNFIL